MTRQQIVKFYENKIDDVADKKIRESLFNKLEEIDELLLSLDVDIDNEIEYQNDSLPSNDEYCYDYNYYRSVINQ